MSRHFVVVGAQRSGTTWLHDLLAAHPDIAMARPSRPEPKVFLREGAVSRAEYRGEFFGHATGQSVLGEKSTSYLGSADAPSRVQATLGHPQIVVQLRDPLARAVSHWRFSRQHGLETMTLTQALRADLHGADRPWDRSRYSVSPFAYISRGRYADVLPSWADRFDLRVQFLEEMREDPARLGSLYRWLGVDDTVRPLEWDSRPNASIRPDEPLDPELVEEIRDYYAASDATLTRLLGREVPWPARSNA
ncbi:MAG: sulfotransferase [Ornithinimicrobium sp.]